MPKPAPTYSACVVLLIGLLLAACEPGGGPAAGEEGSAQPETATPAPAASLVNGDFERGLRGWRNSSDNRMSLPNRDAARTGKRGLRVIDQHMTLHSRLRSDPVRAELGKTYRLTFESRTIADGGINVYFEFVDAKGERIVPPAGDRIHVKIPDAPSDWARYELSHAALPGSAAVVVVIQSNGRANVTADFDNFELQELP